MLAVMRRCRLESASLLLRFGQGVLNCLSEFRTISTSFCRTCTGRHVCRQAVPDATVRCARLWALRLWQTMRQTFHDVPPLAMLCVLLLLFPRFYIVTTVRERALSLAQESRSYSAVTSSWYSTCLAVGDASTALLCRFGERSHPSHSSHVH